MRAHPFRLLTATALVLAALAVGTTASQADPVKCEPAVDVDNSDPATTKITISADCEASASFRRIITATAGGAEILRLDTSVALAAHSQTNTELTLPKVQVCIEDPDAGEQTCIPT